MAANEITQYLLLFLAREFPGLDVWRNNRVDAMAIGAGGKMRKVQAGIDGQADLTGAYEPAGGRRIELEIKGPKDQQRQTQKDFEFRMKRNGSLYMICNIRKKETVEEIRGRLAGLKNSTVAMTIEHPQEIAAFFAELGARLRREA